MKRFFTLFLLTSSIALFGQTYRVTVETYVSNKLEDKFSFSLKQGDVQTKGFDGKLYAKRYRAHGYPHRGLQEKMAIEKEEKLAKKNATLKPEERVKSMLESAKKALASAETRYSVAEGAKQSIEEKVKELEDLDALASKGSSTFTTEYNVYLKRNGLTEEDAKVEKLFRKRPRNTGDVDEIDLGSFCKMKLLKTADKKVMVSMDYSYSRIMTYFYSDGNNNDNTITKHPIVERFEKLDVNNLVLTVGKPYCYQFTRLTPEKARSLADALAQSGIFGGGDGQASESSAKEEASPLDTEGDYKEIKRKFFSDSGKVVRVVITLRFED